VSRPAGGRHRRHDLLNDDRPNEGRITVRANEYLDGFLSRHQRPVAPFVATTGDHPWDTRFVLDLVDAVYLASVLGNRPRPIDRR